MAAESSAESAGRRSVRVGVRMRVLAAMSFAMTLFFLALLVIVYHQVAGIGSASVARRTVVSLVPWVVGILVICGGGFFYLTNYFVLRPIKKIRDGALAISAGQLDTVISTTGNDEIGDLAKSVVQMASVLKQDIESLKNVDALKSEFIAISSHSLRTPLASIEGGLDMLSSTALDEQARKMLGIIRASASTLIAFSEDMLTIANIEAKQGAALTFKAVPLNAVLGPLISELTALARKRGITFTANLAAANAPVQANVPLLRLAFRNILDNACKFTKPGGSVTVSSEVQGNRVVVRVVDTGVGIAKQEIANLFTKFHRGTDTLTYNYEGTGVGLYVAKLILDQHHATISIDSEQDKGTEVTVRLPGGENAYE